jgi:DNA processing protein
MTTFEALVGLNLVPEIGSVRLKKLLEVFETPEKILGASVDALSAVEGIGEKIARDISSFKKEDLDRELALAKKLGLKIITWVDAHYPENLKTIYDPPIVLYVKGELKAEDALSIAIVGSRRPSFYGLNAAGEFAYELAHLGITIVSGLAYGIDTQAHRGALKASGRTLAVMGSGFKHIYPPENQELAEEIANNGAVISEFPLGSRPLRQNFPRRNRVISGLSLGVLVAEAARNSGALITADFALEQGREVFALPGKIDSATSFGTNALIKQGAKLVSNVEDMLEELSPAILNHSTANKKQDLPVSFSEGRSSGKKIELTNEESLLYNSLSLEPLHLDEIVDITGIETSQTLNILFALQMKRLALQLPGKQFVRNG